VKFFVKKKKRVTIRRGPTRNGEGTSQFVKFLHHEGRGPFEAGRKV